MSEKCFTAFFGVTDQRAPLHVNYIWSSTACKQCCTDTRQSLQQWQHQAGKDLGLAGSRDQLIHLTAKLLSQFQKYLYGTFRITQILVSRLVSLDFGLFLLALEVFISIYRILLFRLQKQIVLSKTYLVLNVWSAAVKIKLYNQIKMQQI